ncbi:MAG TPA: cyclic nucleotide-binding domain-containing protein [Bdellovibrionota bacterium]|jgi:hypothetical protein
MSGFWANVAQFAYFFMFLGLLCPSIHLLRKFFLAGSVLAVLFALKAEAQPLWVPLAWHGAFILLNGIQVTRDSFRRHQQKLDPMEQFLKDTAFQQFSNEEVRSFIRHGMEGKAEPEGYLARTGEASQDICCILQGTAEIFENGVKIGEVAAGRLIGMHCLLGEATVYYDVIAKTEVSAMVWTLTAIHDWVGKDTKRLAALQGVMGAQIVEQIAAENAAKRMVRTEEDAA